MNTNKTKVENQLKNVRAENKKLQNGDKQRQIENCRTGIVVRNLPLHKDCSDGKESREQTEEVISGWIKEIQADNKIAPEDIKSYRRLPESKTPGKAPAVFINFTGTHYKATIFQKLKEAKLNKKSAFAKASVADLFPSFLREKVNKLENFAYQLRQQDKNIKTRICYKGTTLVLKKRTEDGLEEIELPKEIDDSPDEFQDAPEEPASTSSASNGLRVPPEGNRRSQRNK